MKLKEVEWFDLPIIKGDVMPSPVLSMDEYLQFVEFCWKNTFNREADEEWRKISAVNVPFIL